jgi:hypothetical protein
MAFNPHLGRLGRDLLDVRRVDDDSGFRILRSNDDESVRK